MTNKEYLDYLVVTGRVPNLKGYEALIESGIDLKKYHEIIAKLKIDFKDELLLLERLYKLYQTRSKEVNEFIIGLKEVIEKYEIYNNDNEIMLLEFKKNMDKLVKLFYGIGYDKELSEKMLKMLKIHFRPSIVKYDKLYRVLYTDNISGFAIQGNDLRTIEDKIGMIVYQGGNMKIHKINLMKDRIELWRDIKNNIDDYDYVCVDERCKVINFNNILNYLYDNRKEINGLWS